MSTKKTLIHLLALTVIGFVLAFPAAAQAEKQQLSGILIDNTGSMRTQFDIVVDVAKGIVERTSQRGPISLYPFKTLGKSPGSVAVISPDAMWSDDKEALENELDDLFVVPGQTKLMDAISSVALELNAKVSENKDAYSGKVIFLVTDGEDRSSKISEKDLIKLLKDSGIQVFAVGLVNELDSVGGLISKPTRGRSVSFLQRITKETGGRAVFAKSKRDDPKSLLAGLFDK
jgi:von Willebrand factor type A domain-containing protein